jgi:hypothetical protein
VSCCSYGLRQASRSCPYLAINQHGSTFAYLDLVDIPIKYGRGGLSDASLHRGYGWLLTEVPRRPNAGKIGLSSTRTLLHFCFALPTGAKFKLNGNHRPLQPRSFRHLMNNHPNQYCCAQALSPLPAAVITAILHSSPLAAATCLHDYNCSNGSDAEYHWSKDTSNLQPPPIVQG